MIKLTVYWLQSFGLKEKLVFYFSGNLAQYNAWQMFQTYSERPFVSHCKFDYSNGSTLICANFGS